MTSLEKAAYLPVAKLIPYIGYGEKDSIKDIYKMDVYGKGKWTLFAQYFDDLYNKGIHFYNGRKNGNDWCDMTVDWAICQAFGYEIAASITYQNRNCAGAGCLFSASYYRKNNRWYGRNTTPKTGDQIFFGTYGSEHHTGIVEYVENNIVHTIEGNSGKKVARRSYAVGASNISGYGRPRYEDPRCIAIAEKENNISNEENKEIAEEASKQQEEFQTALEAAYKVVEELKNVININQVTITELKEAKTITVDNILDKIRKTGDTSWFTNFQEKYKLLLVNFNINLNKINQICYSKLRDDPESLLFEFQNKSIKDWNTLLSEQQLIITNQIPSPLKTPIEYKGIKFLWEKMFNRNLSSSANAYLDDFSGYDEACYSGYEEAKEYYKQLLKEQTEKFNQACINTNLQDAWTASFNILQINVYLLYFYVFGHIERNIKTNEETDDNTVENNLENYEYVKTGVAYNFGFSNEDYWTFYEAANKLTKIFSTNLYLPDSVVNTRYLEWLLLIYDLKNKYNDYIKIIESCAEAISMLTGQYYEYLLALKREKCYNNKNNPIYVDWRELIYQMARDYFDYYQNPKYNYTELMYNANGPILQKDGSTGYEVFYTDILGFWRELYYNPLFEAAEYDIITVANNRDAYYNISEDNYDYNYNTKTCWWNLIAIRPSALHFWFDLTEGYDELAKYTISQVGDRLKATKDNTIKALYYKDTPNIIYYEASDIPIVENNGYNSYTYFQAGGPLLDAYTISSQGKTAIDLLQDQLYKFAFCVENITITSLPIYTLKPNYKVLIKSQTPGLSGEYIISKYSIPFTYSGTMQITATKAVPYIGING